VDIFKTFFPTGISLGHALHVIDVLIRCHMGCSALKIGFGTCYPIAKNGAMGVTYTLLFRVCAIITVGSYHI
jgi:hypothetical protein